MRKTAKPEHPASPASACTTVKQTQKLYGELAVALPALERVEALADTYEGGAEKLTLRSDLVVKYGLHLALRRQVAAYRKDAQILSFFSNQILAAIHPPEHTDITLTKGTNL